MAVSPQHFTEIGGLRVQFRLRGEGPPLLLLHGWGGSSLSFMAASVQLEKRFRTLAPDLPGFGFSEAPKEAWGSADYARVVAELVRSAGFESVDVIGHSRGGTIAVALATAYPELVRRLVLVGSPVVRLPADPNLRQRNHGYTLARRVATLLPPLRNRILGWARERYGSEDYKAAGVLRPTLVRVVNEDWRPALAAIQKPVLLIWGSQDEDVPLRVAEEAAKELPNARLSVLGGAGHFPFLDQTDAFVATVTGFLGSDD